MEGRRKVKKSESGRDGGRDGDGGWGGGGGPKGNNPAKELSDPIIIART